MPRTVLALLTLLALAGCAARDQRPAAVLGWQQRFTEAGTQLGRWFATLDQAERDTWMHALAADGGALHLRQDGRPTPLVAGPIPAAALRARLDAIALLGRYADLLAALATEDGDAADRPVPPAADETRLGGWGAPASALGRILATAAAGAARDELLAQAVRSGTPAVERLLDLLEADLALCVGPLRLTGAAQALDDLVADYNRRRAGLDPAQRLDLLRRAARQAEVVEALRAGPPLRLCAAMRAAHRRLATVAAARRPPSPTQLAALRQALDDLAAETAAADAALRGSLP